jgi:hypothetical protein
MAETSGLNTAGSNTSHPTRQIKVSHYFRLGRADLSVSWASFIHDSAMRSQTALTCFLVLVGSLLMPARAVAAEDEFSASNLYDYCSEHDKGTKETACTAFIHGLLDGLLLGSSAKKYCPPEQGVSVSQGRLIIQKFMRENPKMLNGQAGIAAALAMVVAFPCKSK